MTKICDHTSVGMLVWNSDKLLLIERARFPFGFAVPAGHVDGDPTYEEAARRELKEEVGLGSLKLELLLDERKDNPCRREGGTWHHWKVYKVDATGRLDRSEDETKQARWFSIDEIKELARKTESYLNKSISEEAWQKDAGLEPIMYELFKELKLI